MGLWSPNGGWGWGGRVALYSLIGTRAPVRLWPPGGSTSQFEVHFLRGERRREEDQGELPRLLWQVGPWVSPWLRKCVPSAWPTENLVSSHRPPISTTLKTLSCPEGKRHLAPELGVCEAQAGLGLCLPHHWLPVALKTKCRPLSTQGRCFLTCPTFAPQAPWAPCGSVSAPHTGSWLPFPEGFLHQPLPLT